MVLAINIGFIEQDYLQK